MGLSGGQRARVSLARAIYSRASTILLDDIISALDAHTTKAIVKDLFQGELTKNRTIVLVTHHIKLLIPVAAHVVLLDNGDIKYAGGVKDFVEAGHMEQLDEVQGGEPSSPSTPSETDTEGLATSKKADQLGGLDSQAGIEEANAVENAIPSRPPRKLVEDEARQTGGIAWSTWKTYLQAQGSIPFWICLGTITVLGACPPLIENTILNK